MMKTPTDFLMRLLKQSMLKKSIRSEIFLMPRLSNQSSFLPCLRHDTSIVQSGLASWRQDLVLLIEYQYHDNKVGLVGRVPASWQWHGPALIVQWMPDPLNRLNRPLQERLRALVIGSCYHEPPTRDLSWSGQACQRLRRRSCSDNVAPRVFRESQGSPKAPKSAYTAKLAKLMSRNKVADDLPEMSENLLRSTPGGCHARIMNMKR